MASISPEGVVAETVDAFGTATARAEVGLGRAPGPHATARALTEAVTLVRSRVRGRLRTAVISVADPVDRATGRLVHLPDAPFLVGDLDPAAVLADSVDCSVDGAVLVDNDINWAARAERATGCALGVDDFVYVHLGEGLGCAVVTDAEVRRGHHGLAGEIAHLYTAGPGTALPFIEVFAELGLRRADSTAIDVDALRGAALGDSAAARRTRGALARAVGGVLAAAVALADPQLIVLGGLWGAEPGIAEAIREHFAELPRSVPVVAAQVAEPELAGARARAVEELRTAIITTPRPESSD